ncbi:MAG: type IV toxin-antitoxin system AbiEi family antitoxin domain-containing protein [Dermatophilaceae bacterium]
MGTTALDPALAAVTALAAGQRGMFTTAQARRVAVGDATLTRLVRGKHLVHPGRGLYAVASLVSMSAESWHRHLCAGAGLLYADATLTSHSAVLAHDLPLWGVDLARPALHRPVDRAVGMKAFWIRPTPTRADRPALLETHLGPAEDVATAVVQLAIDHGTVPGVVTADAALHAGRTVPADIDAAVQRVSTWPRSSRARAMTILLDGRSESVGESRCRVELVTYGIPVTPQVEVRDVNGELVGRADLCVNGTRVLVEFDGRMKYTSGDPGVLWAEKRREDRLRALGWMVARITWADLERPGAVVATVRRALRQAA